MYHVILCFVYFFFFKQKTAYEMRISDWSSDVCSSDLLNLKLEDKQEVLEIDDAQARIEHVMRQLENEIDVLQIEKKIRTRVKQQMEKNQREYYLNEQMKAIQKELGESEDGPNEQEELASKVEKAGMHKRKEEKH